MTGTFFTTFLLGFLASFASADEGTCEAPGDASFSSNLKLYVAMVFAFPTVFWLTAYLIPQLFMAFRPVPNLQKKYDAKWALVTGSGSGIGRAIAFKLASQGLNVVLVSLDDKFLKDTVAALKKEYPKLEFRAVGCTFSPGQDYMKQIEAATKDIEVPIIFNNAGFMVTGFLDQAPIGKLLANMECNATACVNVSHFFVQKLIKKKQKGCIVFTSSVAGFIPTPFAAMYVLQLLDVSGRMNICSFYSSSRFCYCVLIFLGTRVPKLLSPNLQGES